MARPGVQRGLAGRHSGREVAPRSADHAYPRRPAVRDHPCWSKTSRPSVVSSQRRSSALGTRCSRRRDGVEGLAAVSTRMRLRVDLRITDLRMPEMDGESLVRDVARSRSGVTRALRIGLSRLGGRTDPCRTLPRQTVLEVRAPADRAPGARPASADRVAARFPTRYNPARLRDLGSVPHRPGGHEGVRPSSGSHRASDRGGRVRAERLDHGVRLAGRTGAQRLPQLPAGTTSDAAAASEPRHRRGACAATA